VTLEAYLAAVARAEAERPALEESLLGGRFLRYARHRLTGFAAARLAATLVTLVEYLLLARLIGGKRLLGSLAVANACQLAVAFWWGGLEVLRTRVRAQSKAAAQREISAWLGHAGLAAALALAAAAAAAAIAGATVASMYALVCVARLAVDLVARTLYSGVYARARIYRPTLSLVVAEPIGLVAVAAGARALGPWAFPAGLLVATLVSRGLGVAYTLRAYRAQRLPRPRPTLRGARVATPATLLAGAANLATRAPSLLVLALVSAGARDRAVTFHVVAPLLVAAATWTQVFYLDLKRLEGPAPAILLARLERALARLALAAGPVLWLLALGAAGWAGAPPGPGLAAALLALFVGQSAMAAFQLAHFVRGRFLRLAASGTLVAAGLVLAARPALAAAALLAGVAVLLAAVRAPRPPPAGARRRSATLATPLGARALAAWLAERAADVEVRGARVAWLEDRGPIDDASLVVAAAGLLAQLGPAPDPPARPPPAGARVLDVARGTAPELPPRVRQQIWRQAVAAARGARARDRSRHRVAVELADGAIARVFVSSFPR
jgi:hypothetical protein